VLEGDGDHAWEIVAHPRLRELEAGFARRAREPGGTLLRRFGLRRVGIEAEWSPEPEVALDVDGRVGSAPDLVYLLTKVREFIDQEMAP
jgi:hypothetical protein